MSQNPYESSVANTASNLGNRGDESHYRSVAFQAKAITILLVLLSAIHLLAAVADTSGFLLFEGYSDPQAEVNVGLELAIVVTVVALAAASVLVYLAAVVFVCVFMYRANANLRALGATHLTYTPGWCVGYWFIPFANLVSPYRAMKELYLCSESPTDSNWKNGAVLSAFQPWWACWLIGSFLSRIETRLALRGIDTGSAGIFLSLAATFATVAAAYLLIRIVNPIHKNLESHYQRLLTQQETLG